MGNDFRKENGYIAAKILLNHSTPPTAIFSTSDLITLGVLEALHEEKVKCPDDISLVAFDDFDFAPFLVSPLTVVKQPRELMGEIAVRLLIENMMSKGKTERKKIKLKPELVVRNSVLNLRKAESLF